MEKASHRLALLAGPRRKIRLDGASGVGVNCAMHSPTDIQVIGTEVAIRWDDGRESFITFATLRANSPSAEVKGERDVFGTVYGGEAPRDHRGVEVTGWERIGNYAIRFDFSDGHRTGLYSYELLRKLGETGAAT
jgi:DUF971 family protein